MVRCRTETRGNAVECSSCCCCLLHLSFGWSVGSSPRPIRANRVDNALRRQPWMDGIKALRLPGFLFAGPLSSEGDLRTAEKAVRVSDADARATLDFERDPIRSTVAFPLHWSVVVSNATLARMQSSNRRKFQLTLLNLPRTSLWSGCEGERRGTTLTLIFPVQSLQEGFLRC
jgi:hypothetical protein